jgi:hypothetical protein
VTTTGVEPAHPKGHYPLKVARLPIPPRGRRNIAFVESGGKDTGIGKLSKFEPKSFPSKYSKFFGLVKTNPVNF